MKLNRVFPYFMLVVLLAGILAACSPAATAQPAEPAQPAVATQAPAQPAATEVPTAAPAATGGTLVIAMNLDDVVTLDPAYAGETTNLFIHINTYDTLVDIRPEDLNTIVPRLAEKWEVNADFTEFTFHLRKDAKFASGNPVTAQDVVFSWNRLLNVAGAPAFNLDGVGKVEARCTVGNLPGWRAGDRDGEPDLGDGRRVGGGAALVQGRGHAVVVRHPHR